MVTVNSGRRTGAAPGHVMLQAMVMRRDRFWLTVGGAGFLIFMLVFLAIPALSRPALVLAIALPVIAFYRILMPRIGHRQCPRPPEWTQR